MGVIRNFNNYSTNRSQTDEDWIYISSDGEDDYDNQSSPINIPARNLGNSRSRRSQQRLRKSTNKPEPTFAGLGVKGKSHKKHRRYANANLLSEFGSLVNENELDDVSIDDFIPSSPSSFSLLMTNDISDSDFNFNDFINCTEEQQNKMLKEVFELELSEVEQSHNHHPDIDGVTLEDFDLCFARIAPAIRKRLLKKHVPIGLLASIEQKVIDHFRNDPNSIYKTILQCSFHRFLLHACCQYLSLYCRSSTTKGKRLSCVHNEKNYFVEPSKKLSEYLDFNTC